MGAISEDDEMTHSPTTFCQRARLVTPFHSFFKLRFGQQKGLHVAGSDVDASRLGGFLGLQPAQRSK